MSRSVANTPQNLAVDKALQGDKQDIKYLNKCISWFNPCDQLREQQELVEVPVPVQWRKHIPPDMKQPGCRVGRVEGDDHSKGMRLR